MISGSKPIQKTDDDCKKFIIEALQGDCTHGFDIDSIYFCDGQWYIFEYLKCDNEYMTPWKSDPKYYPYNWKKFYSLYSLTKKLDGKLFLVNYSVRPNDSNEVKLMEVLYFDLEKAKAYNPKINVGPYEYMTLHSYKMSKEEFSTKLRLLNSKSSVSSVRGGI